MHVQPTEEGGQEASEPLDKGKGKQTSDDFGLD